MLCMFCDQLSKESENVILINDICRVILVDNQYYPGYVQIILNNHVKELTELTLDEGLIIFKTIWLMEEKIRKTFKPDKINIASLGNVVPHLHWHIIPRYSNDRHFPNSIWGNVVNPNYLPDNHLYELVSDLTQL